MNVMEAPLKNLILCKTNYGLDIYAHILKECFPDDGVVMHLSGRDCGLCRNPFNGGKLTLHIWIEKSDMPESLFCEYARHEDVEGAMIPGDAFDFAERYYRKSGDELRRRLDLELGLRISEDLFHERENRQQNVMTGMRFVPVFSFFRAPITNTVPYKSITILEAYAYIRGKYALDRTARLRATADAKRRRQMKAECFDYCTFSGVFTSRGDKNLVKHSGLLCIDFDHVENVERLADSLLYDRFFETQLMFRSPSGDGLKWVIATDITDGASHRDYFSAIGRYIGRTYGVGIDPTGKDVSRACFLPHDSRAYVNPKYL